MKSEILKSFFGWSSGTKVNEVPEEAILASELARDPQVREESGAVKPGRETGNPGDPYSEERVSRDFPEAAQVRNSPPDTKVLPG